MILFLLHVLISVPPTDCKLSESLFVVDRTPNSFVINLLRQCSREWHMGTITIVNDCHIVDAAIYQNIFEGFHTPIRTLNDSKTANLTDTRICVLLCFKIQELNFFLEDSQELLWSPTNVYILHCIEHVPVKDHRFFKYLASILHRLGQKRHVYNLVLSVNGNGIFFDPFERRSPIRILESFLHLGYVGPRTVGDASGNRPENGSSLSANGSVDILGNLRIVMEDDNFSVSRYRENFQGYELHVAAFPYMTMRRIRNEYFGADGLMMSTILKMMNVTPSFYEPKEMFGWAENNRFVGTLGGLIYGMSDVSFNGFFIKDYGTRRLEFTTYLSSDQICVMVPEETYPLEYLSIVKIFKVESWILILWANFVITFIYVGTKRATLRKRERRKESSMNFLMLLVFYCIYPLERANTRICERLVLLGSLLLGIVLSGSFTSKLASSLSKPAFLPSIDTLKDLDKSGLPILTNFPNLLSDVFSDSTTSTHVFNLRTKLTLTNESDMMNRALIMKNAGFLARKQQILLNEIQVDRLHLVKECPKTYLLSYLVPKGSPFLPRINAIIGRVQSAGLYKKWFKDTINRIDISEVAKPVVISLPHLYIPFTILFVGLGLGVIIFVFEFIFFRLSNK